MDKIRKILEKQDKLDEEMNELFDRIQSGDTSAIDEAVTKLVETMDNAFSHRQLTDALSDRKIQ